MSDRSDNPFVRYGLDPAADLAELTAALRALTEDASPEEQVALRRAFELLSRSPARRFELALEAGPTPAPLPPPSPSPSPIPAHEPRLADVLAPGPLAPLLPPETDAEAALRRLDVTFLRRDDEAAIAGPIPSRHEQESP